MRRAGAPPLGLFASGRYPEESFALEEGDFMILMSDGVRELRNPRGEILDFQGIEKALRPFQDESAEDIVKKIFLSMDSFSKGRPAHDDRTVLCVKIGKGAN